MFRSRPAIAACLWLFVSGYYAVAATGTSESFTCNTSPNETFLAQASRFVLATLRFTPVEATQAGYHGNADVSLDNQLDDMSPETLAAQHLLFVKGRVCFAALQPKDPEDAADLALLRDSIESSLFQLDSLQTYKYRPQDYVEMIGSGLFFPLTSTSASETDRLSAILARMEQVPKVLDQARQNVQDADPLFIATALSENAGNTSLIAQIGGMIAPSSPLRSRYETASMAALAALSDYNSWLKDDLGKHPHHVTWRNGSALYAKIFAFALGPGTHETPDSILTAAGQTVIDIRARMYTLALPLHKQWFADHGDHGHLTGDALQNKVIQEVIDRINDDHVEPAQLLEKVTAQAAGIRAFIQQKDLLTLTGRGNMKIIPTPEFLRGEFSVAGFHAAPVFEPDAEAEYWVTPIDPKTPKAEADSKLREYNNWMLQWLTMHEALPGHYVQFEHADGVQPVSRRVLRGLLGNGAYVEGWAEYSVKEMEEAGYADHDPRFLLMVEKIRLRATVNAILDISMQSRDMTDQQALALLEYKAFQTEAEAEGKVRRAKLTAGQLITYYVGYRQWIDLRDRVQQLQGSRFSLKKFNDQALDEGPLPIPLLAPLLITTVSRN